MRPKRVYKQGTKYYYIINGKRKYIKMPKKLSDKQIININIKTGDNSGRKIKKRKRRKTMKYTKKLIPDMTERATSAVINYPQQNVQFLPATLYQPKKTIDSLSDKIELQTKMLIEDKKDKEKKDNLLMIKDEVKKEIDNIKKITNILEIEDKPKKQPFRLLLPDYDNETRKYEGDIIDFLEETDVYNKKTSDYDIFKLYLIKFKNPPAVWKYMQESKTNDMKLLKFFREIRSDYIFNKKKKIEADKKDKKDKESGSIEGKGHNADVDGLWNTDIEKIVEKKINNIVPVIAADGGGELMPYIKKNMPSFSFIINRVGSDYDGTGSNGEPSGHWIAVYINNNDDFQSCEIYDSLADVPSTELIKLCKKICKMINPQTTFKLKINHLKNQSNTTETCGYHAIKFLEDRNNGVPWSEATNYDSYIENLNHANNEVEGENKLHKVINDYNLYL
jgi:hypothetical protein